MATTILLWTLLSALALPATSLPASTLPRIDSPPPSHHLSTTPKRCTNALSNPSFESGLSPWLDMVSGSFSTRGIFTSADGGQSGQNFYYAHSNATVDSTLTVSQSGFSVQGGGQVECAAWVASRRLGNVGSTRVEVFLDGVSCGVQYLGTAGWTRVGGQVAVTGDVHTLAVVIVSDEAGDEGWTVWVDGLAVGAGC